MWFRFVMALAVIAMLGFVWMMLSPTLGPTPGAAVKPAVTDTK